MLANRWTKSVSCFFQPNVSCLRFSSSSSSSGYAEYERKKFARRFGNITRHHDKGLLPRLSRQEAGLKSIPVKATTNPWHPRNALLGQNDYIDILGTGNTHPATLLKHIPWYLRGWRGHEMEMLQRQAAVDTSMETSRPEKWHYLQKRISYLYHFRNRRSKPPAKCPKYI
ncbi:39S ribosomal protein L51, mitochondrial-like [Panonychus citri]|uniref:39S ribosomal protein L51, mitochondrial-like n=1 Tax=Panonychus citri TaxID=50023 RepID=UPI002307C54E|nr:39S ribosomal protein L51, mitochondrial-like [Panonychus citri]XP_053203785.1 39S ribosomal protein L51, mitochondrial-like [Panonychus citri]XP_053203860.1 39S ribosomal protein L51, mitochondrial-like [Panonychus citri]